MFFFYYFRCPQSIFTIYANKSIRNFYLYTLHRNKVFCSETKKYPVGLLYLFSMLCLIPVKHAMRCSVASFRRPLAHPPKRSAHVRHNKKKRRNVLESIYFQCRHSIEQYFVRNATNVQIKFVNKTPEPKKFNLDNRFFASRSIVCLINLVPICFPQ